MEHTYLRYECADFFGIVASSASAKSPLSNSCLAFLDSQTVLATAGSAVVGYNMRSGETRLKLAHSSGSAVGSGRALNADQVVCIDSGHRGDKYLVATGWVDGAVRIFEVSDVDAIPTVHSLLQRGGDFSLEGAFGEEPLVLKGHNNCVVRVVSFDMDDAGRLCSGGSDGSVVVWDVVSETGLFRLIGHSGAITDTSFVGTTSFDGLVTSSLDGLVKVWNLDEQCCTQSIANHQGHVLGSCILWCREEEDEAENGRSPCRLLTGAGDGRVRVWTLRNESKAKEREDQDTMFDFVGKLPPPTNVGALNKVLCVRANASGCVAVLPFHSRSVHIYQVRNLADAQKKKRRRLRRRGEKQRKKDGMDISMQKGLLDDDDSTGHNDEEPNGGDAVDPELINAVDEFQYLGCVHASHKVNGIVVDANRSKEEVVRIVCTLSTNALETHALVRKKGEFQSVKVSSFENQGHPTGVRSVALTSDDRVCATVSKASTKVWNVATRSCVLSVPNVLHLDDEEIPCYGLCTVFLPGNSHVLVGSREGHLLLIDISSGSIAYCEKSAHDGAIWSMDVMGQVNDGTSIQVVTGSADRSVKFWNLETNDEGSPVLGLTRALQMQDDVVAVKYSHTVEKTKRFVFVATLDNTIKVFFEDSLKLFLSLYGHKLPVLALDSSDDDTILASGGADKLVKIFGLDFGDTHKSLYGHTDTITDLEFVKRTHMFWTTSKDGTVRCWDADRFQQIQILEGHFAEVNSLAIGRTGAFVLSGGMDRQVRVWERTGDIVFLEEERERELEGQFDKISSRDQVETAEILDSNENGEGSQRQSDAVGEIDIFSIGASDRIMEGIELADKEAKEKRSPKTNTTRQTNPLLYNLDPEAFVLRVLQSVKASELDQSLVLLPFTHVERLLYYLIELLKRRLEVELCARVSIFLVKTHQNQLRHLLRSRLQEARDIVGYDVAAMKLVSRMSTSSAKMPDECDDTVNVWAGLGLGAELAAARKRRLGQ